MRSRTLGLLLGAAAGCALCCTAAAAHGLGGGRGTAGFGQATLVHRHPTPVGHVRFRFGPRFRAFGFRASPELSVTVAGDDDMDDYDMGGYDDGDLADMHFRAEESFGPWDIGMRPPPPDYASGPWEAARMDPWHGYEPQDSW